MPKKMLLLDLEAAALKSDEMVECAYFYHPNNNGLKDLREMAAFALTCRHCEEKPCVTACTKDALEKLEDSSVVRHNLRCVGCGSCVTACPFGVISPDVINYISSVCDQCMLFGDEEPPCVKSAPEGVLEWVDEDDTRLKEDNVHMLGERLAVKCNKWEREVSTE